MADFIVQGEKSSLQGVSSGELCSGCFLVFNNTFDLCQAHVIILSVFK